MPLIEDLGQPDLFGEWDAEHDAKAARAARATEWAEWLRAEPRPLPYDTQGLGDEGDLCDQWWRCPACGDVELGSYALWINHGFHPDYVDQSPWAWDDHGGCYRVNRLKDRGQGLGEAS